MAYSLKTLAAAALIALPGAALAQETALDIGQPVPLETYIDGVFGDWSRECLRNPDGDDPCQLVQILRETPEANPVGKVTVGKLEEAQGEAVAGSMVILPLGTFLPANLQLKVDSNQARVYPFRFCDNVGCVVQMGLTAQDLGLYKAGKMAKIIISPAAKPDARVEIPMSLTGFTDAYASLGTPGSGGKAEEAPATEAPATEAPATE
ncbi:MAG: hypothetical protein CR993_08910 [Rhodobacterales bacterium]|nr:MAG: hypothetical protein CR993_08910 [Rhodobacterales bacterium]